MGLSDSDCRACRLRDAINNADNGDTIQIPPGTYTLEGGELIIKKNITLEGAGAATTIIQAAAVPGVASHRVINIPYGREVSLSGVTVRHGLVDSSEPRHVLSPGTNSGMWGIPLEFGGGVLNERYIRISNTTVSGNHGNYGGGIAVHHVGGAPTTELNNTIIAANTAALEGADCKGSVTSLGHNLMGSGDHCGMEVTTSDLVGTRSQPVGPRLGPLKNNGGPTETHALLLGSPAIDTGGGNPIPTTDQRGLARPQGGASDIGAYERAAKRRRRRSRVSVIASLGGNQPPDDVGDPGLLRRDVRRLHGDGQGAELGQHRAGQ